MRAGTSERNDWGPMNTAVAASASRKFFHRRHPAVSVAYVRAKARSIQRTHGLACAIDYLGLMRGTGDNRAREVGSISALKGPWPKS